VIPYSRSEMLVRHWAEDFVSSRPDGPEREAWQLLLSALQANDRDAENIAAELNLLSAEERERTHELLKAEQRVEEMYINELRLHGLEYNGGVERTILSTLHSCFLLRYPPEEVHDFFAPFARSKKKKESSGGGAAPQRVDEQRGFCAGVF
jgi:hypothetical protein